MFFFFLFVFFLFYFIFFFCIQNDEYLVVSQPVNSRLNTNMIKDGFANLFRRHRFFDDARTQHLVARKGQWNKTEKTKKNKGFIGGLDNREQRHSFIV